MQNLTQEKWSFDYQYTDKYIIVDKQQKTVCTFEQMPKPLDLRLIEHAPEMYALLLEMRDKFCKGKRWEGTEIRYKLDFLLGWAGEYDDE